jgi:hypothetical protein
MLQVLRKQFEKGYVGRLDVAAQESQLARVTATLPPLLKQLAQQRDLLAALSGWFPSDDLAEKFDLASLQLPQELPLCVPSQLVGQRLKDAELSPAEKKTAARFQEFGCTTCHQIVTPRRMGLTSCGAKLKSMHMACTDPRKRIAPKQRWLLGSGLGG